MEKLDGKSMDIVSENIAKLKELFLDIFSEGKMDFEALEATLGEYMDAKEERYSFNWNGKAKARRIAQTPLTLKEQYESDDLVRVVFRDNGFKDAEVKTNAIQILKQSVIDYVKSL